jgi:phosphatidate cytidylyltransferase
MDDQNEPQSGRPPRPPTRTEQLRIVGAEEAGALMGQAGRARPDGPLDGPPDDNAPEASGPGDERGDSGDNGREADLDDDGFAPGRRPRSVFESIPDAPPSFVDEMDDPNDETGAGGGDAVERERGSAVPPERGSADDVTRAVPAASRRPQPAGPAGEGGDDGGDEDDDAWLSSLSDPEHSGETDPGRFGAVPVVRVEGDDRADRADEAASEGLELPHWTEPPTGQVPKVLVDEEREDDSWSTFGASPRWRDPSTEWDAEDYSDVSDLADDLPREGALDEGDRPSLDEFFSFDDLEPAPAARRRAPSGDAPEPAADTGPRSGGGGRRPGPPGGETSVAGSAATQRNMGIAIGAGVTLGVVALLLLRWGPGPTMVLVTAAVGIAAAELLATARRVGYHPAALVGLAASAGLPLAVYWRGEAAYPLVLFLAVAFTLFWYLFGVDTERPAQSAGITVLAIGYVGVLGSFGALILRNGSPLGTNTMLAIILPTVAADVGAFVVGRNAGRSPLSPVSPNKTVEGALGGFAAAVVVSVLFNHFILDLEPFDSLGDAAILGVVIGIVALLGDLCESLLKRSFGVKDMGTIIPGHGGVLDRFDALLFALPSAYYLARLLDLLPR